MKIFKCVCFHSLWYFILHFSHIIFSSSSNVSTLTLLSSWKYILHKFRNGLFVLHHNKISADWMSWSLINNNLREYHMSAIGVENWSLLILSYHFGTNILIIPPLITPLLLVFISLCNFLSYLLRGDIYIQGKTWTTIVL